MNTLKSLRFSMRFLGFNEKCDRFGWQIYTYMVVQVIMGVNITYFLMERWRDLDDRIIALKTIAFILTYFSYSVSLVFYWNDFLSVIKLFYKTNFDIPYKMSTERKNLIHQLNMKMGKLDKTWWTIIVAYVTPFNVIPLITVLIKVWVMCQDFQEVIKENLSAPFPLYYPRSIENSGDLKPFLSILTYVAGYALHSVYMLFTCVYAHLAHVTTLCAMADVEYELKLLQLSLVEMDKLIQVPKDEIKNMLNSLSKFRSYFVKHHQDTYRRFEIVNVGIKWIVATVGTTASLYMCMSIYTIVQKDQVVLKAQEGIFFGLWAFAIYLFDVCGERVKTEDERLRQVLYECPWENKPKWFKDAIRLSMLRNCRPMDIKPFGLFAFNLNSYAKTMNAAYSYYNLLYNFKNK